MTYQEHAVRFHCQQDELFGIVSVPGQVHKRGVLIVVGGPQYRAGSHRQFTLLARALASQGIASMRFDYRGMGDSSGAMRGFDMVDEDLRAAVDQFFAAVPGIGEVVIWGLCDAASAAMFYAGSDARVTGLVLLNPWARTDAGFAKSTLKHYYRSRLLDPGLWKKILGGRFDYAAAGASLLRMVGAALGAHKSQGSGDGHAPSGAPAAPLPERMLVGLGRFKGRVLLIICEADLTAQEFLDLGTASRKWRTLLAAPRITRKTLPGADHTFSRQVWRDQVLGWTAEWVRSW